MPTLDRRLKDCPFSPNGINFSKLEERRAASKAFARNANKFLV
jgi:hypothetical protein